MAPVPFHVGPLPVYGYGVMLLLAFVAGVMVFTLELRRRGLDPRLAREITLIAIISGAVESKALVLVEQGSVASLPSWAGAWRDTMTFYGGPLAAGGRIALYLRVRGVWGTRYDQGLVPPSRALAGLPEIAARYPGGVVPDDTPCHPTPGCEFGLAYPYLRSTRPRREAA
jgi:phosphatidylglycerol---prolipoprotein diacylglyceryl transferase